MALLTDTKARHIRPDDNPLPHGGVTGLALHPSSVKGRGKWVLRFVSPVTQKRRNAGLGSYPEISIADAARMTMVMREQLAAGLDPLELRKTEPTKVVSPTFEKAARQVHADLLPGWRNKKHGKQWISTLEQHAFPLLGNLTLDAITPANIAEVLRPIWLSLSETATRENSAFMLLCSGDGHMATVRPILLMWSTIFFPSSSASVYGPNINPPCHGNLFLYIQQRMCAVTSTVMSPGRCCCLSFSPPVVPAKRGPCDGPKSTLTNRYGPFPVTG